jgi:hypothetical protein
LHDWPALTTDTAVDRDGAWPRRGLRIGRTAGMSTVRSRAVRDFVRVDIVSHLAEVGTLPGDAPDVSHDDYDVVSLWRTGKVRQAPKFQQRTTRSCLMDSALPQNNAHPGIRPTRGGRHYRRFPRRKQARAAAPRAQAHRRCPARGEVRGVRWMGHEFLTRFLSQEATSQPNYLLMALRQRPLFGLRF